MGCKDVIVLLVCSFFSRPLALPEAFYYSRTLCPAEVVVPVQLRLAPFSRVELYSAPCSRSTQLRTAAPFESVLAPGQNPLLSDNT
jgi:hypothetical protein